MSSCPQCGAKVGSGTHVCPECGAKVPTKGVVSAIFTHIPHPRIALRKQHGPVTRQDILAGLNNNKHFYNNKHINNLNHNTLM